MTDSSQMTQLRSSLFSGISLLILTTAPVWAEEPAAPRFAKEIAAFEAADQANPPASGQILFTGSSSVRLWKLKNSFPTLDVLNRGFGGSVIADCVRYFPRIVQPYHPRQVVFYAGDNDIGSKRTPQQIHDDFMQFAALMHEHLPGTPLIFISIKPSIKRWALIDQVRAANALIKAECEKDPLLTYVDVDAPMLDAAGAPRPELYIQDGLHMTPEGYAVWTKALAPHLLPDQRASHFRSLYDAYHPWTPPATLEEWQQAAEKIRRQVLVANGLWPLPEKTELKPVIHGLVDRGDYTIERVSFASLPGHYVTGSLYRPKQLKDKAPAVLCPHGHWQNGRFMQNDPAAAAGELKSGAEQFLSGAIYPVQARMVELARMGCIVFHYDMIGVADNGPLDHRGGFSDANAALWLHNKMGLQTWNSIRALDFVSSLPDVDASRIGVTGASGGGTQTMLLGAIDPRVTVSFPAVMVSTGMQGGCICENADYLRIGINNVALAALMAPRPQAMSGANDWTIAIETKGYPELRQVYGLYGQADLVSARAFPQFQHNYNQVAREMMYDWFNAHLQLGLTSPVKQTDFWPLTKEEMTVIDATHPRPEDALKEPELREKLRARDLAAFQTLLQGDPEHYRAQVGGASQVLLPPLETAINTSAANPPGETEPAPEITDWVVQYDQARVPMTVLSPEKEPQTSHVVLWLTTQGKSHLRSADGQLEPAVKQLLDAGIAVASADLFLTDENLGAHDLYSSRFEKASPSHASSPTDKEYTGFVYGYNRPLIAERVRDIQAAVLALQDLKFTRITLVGAAGTGPWALLARVGLPPSAIDKTIVDLNRFSFAAIQSSADENMLPGALKYGGIGGLSALAFPAKLMIYGTDKSHAEELAPLTTFYAAQPEKLTLSSDSVDRNQLVEQILK